MDGLECFKPPLASWNDTRESLKILEGLEYFFGAPFSIVWIIENQPYETFRVVIFCITRRSFGVFGRSGVNLDPL